jgi:hypothetical protein
MSVDTEHLAALRIVESIRTAFPEEAALADQALARDGYDENAHFTWLERFSEFTTDAIKQRGFSVATKHLNLLSGLLARGDEATVRCIDVAYVEPLMWDIKDEELKREGWRLFPANIRKLFIAMWAEQPFMKGVK